MTSLMSGLTTEQEDFIRKAKINAIIQAPTSRMEAGSEVRLTASERIVEAEIIYQWLIKDLV